MTQTDSKIGGRFDGFKVRTTDKTGPQQIQKKSPVKNEGSKGNKTKGKKTFADVKQID